MSAHVPQSLLRNGNDEHVIDAVYFVVRVLRNGLRGYKDPTVSTEPNIATTNLAKQVIAEIEAAEGHRVADINPRHAEEYISVLEKFVLERASRDTDELRTSAEALLEEMRSQNL